MITTNQIQDALGHVICLNLMTDVTRTSKFHVDC